MVELPKRNQNRLENYDYSQNGAYFVTICVKGRKQILCDIVVGTGVLDCPKTKLLYHGKIADKHMNQLNEFYDDISIDKYTIMPDHIHFILRIKNGQSG